MAVACITPRDLEDADSWHVKLKDAKRLADVVTICMEICAKYEPQLYPLREKGTYNILKGLLWAEDVPHTHRKHISKAFFSLTKFASNHGTMMRDKAAALGANAEAVELTDEELTIVLYGMMHSKFLKRFEDHSDLAYVPYQPKCMFRAEASGYTRWFHTLAECMVMVLEQPESLPRKFDYSRDYNHIWRVALVNLESPYHGVREVMLRLLKQLVARFPLMLVEIEVWHWLDRNKYHLLALLLRESPYKEDLKGSVAFSELDNALEQSLRYKHLVSGGQALLRALSGEQMDTVSWLVAWLARLVRSCDIELLRRMAKYWFTSLSPKCHSEIFNQLQLHTLPPDEHQFPAYLNTGEHDRLFLLTNLFKREFHKQYAHVEQLLQMLCRLAYNERPRSTVSLELLIKTLTYHIANWRWEPANKRRLLDNLQRFVLEAIERPRSMALCNTVVEQCRCLVEKSTDSTNDILVQLLYGMYERYLRPSTGQQSRFSYQQTITAVRLFNLLVGQCFEFPPAHRYQLTPRPAAQYGPWLEHLPSTISSDPASRLVEFRDEVFSLDYLLHSEYDDVCFAVAGMLFNQPRAFSLDGSLLGRLTHIHAHPSADLYPALLAEAERWVQKAIESVHLDLFALATEDGSQLHHAVDRATQVCFGIPELLDTGVDAIEPFRCVARAVGSVVGSVLSLLNVARPIVLGEVTESPLMAGTSFEIMECSMQLLLDRSPEWVRMLASRDSPVSSVEIALAKRSMQAELWKSLRAVATFTEKYAIWLLDHYDQNPEEVDQELDCCMNRFGNILLNCCHRGAIESSASCLTRVVRRIMRYKAQTCSRLVPAAAAVQTIGHVEKLFHKTLAMEPAQRSDFRRARGYLFLLHSIMQAEVEAGVEANSLLCHYLRRHVMLSERAAAEPVDPTLHPIGVLELHQLNLLMKTASMKETMLPYVDQLTVVAFEAFRRPDWPVRNAALQLYTSCTTKLAGQQQQCVDPNCDWPPAYVSLDEVISKLPLTVAYIQRALDGATTVGASRCSTSFLLLLLEFLARFEYRGYDWLDGMWYLTVENFQACVWDLLSHEHDLVRRQAARCYAQLICFKLQPDPSDEIFLAEVDRRLRDLFTDALCHNRRHGLCLALYFHVRRYITLRHFTHTRAHREQYTLSAIRCLVAKRLPPNHGPSTSYRYRTTLLGFLTYIGFKRTDPLLSTLLQHDAAAPNDLGRDTFLMAWERQPAEHGEHGTSSVAMPYEIELELDHDPEQDD
ncbi:uncharacterized protein LOC131290564 [Anopheles ziemanni]|uniref:uncharacterized protein LOC131268865 n=1 Tax=Anopheles coustani TaxID=139045 RepID=UPI00265B11D6|nr:uncharacterized protein LOC131268865 [Anopheles coustani]XP_058175705.1 uncharacterized protein LOC131290564 [Anopheles ziemanni]